MIKRISAIIIVLNVIIIFFSLGIMFVGAYVQTSDWGSFADTRLADISFSMILVGIISIILSIVDLIGMCKQHVSKKLGRRILITHYLCVLLSVFFELYSLSWIMHSSSNLSRVKHEFRSDVKVDYGPLESQFANRMNSIFFAASDCSPDVDFLWFWRWVDEHCAHAGVQEINCACDSYNGSIFFQ